MEKFQYVMKGIFAESKQFMSKWASHWGEAPRSGDEVFFAEQTNTIPPRDPSVKRSRFAFRLRNGTPLLRSRWPRRRIWAKNAFISIIRLKWKSAEKERGDKLFFWLAPLGELRKAVRGQVPKMQIFDTISAFIIALSVTLRRHLSRSERLQLLFRQSKERGVSLALLC